MTTTETETEKPTVEDVTGSLTGFDELAIEKAFGHGIGDLGGTMTLRALVFTLERRTKVTDKDAYGAAMRKTLAEVRDTFADDDEDDKDDKDAEGEA
jgi:hypothetical protein